MTTFEFFILVFIVGVAIYNRIKMDKQYNHYDISKVSFGKMAMDTGASETEIKRNIINGKYDKDSQWKF